MNTLWTKTVCPFLVIGLILMVSACGHKAPPRLPDPQPDAAIMLDQESGHGN